MAWVRSEYAGELAVLAAWLSALLPWSVSVTSQEGLSLVAVRFPFFMFRFLFGADLGAADQPFHTVVAMLGQASNQTNLRAYYVWLGAAVLLGAALLLSFAYYAREERVEAAPVDPVRVMGGLLLGAGLLLAGSTVLLWQGYFGTTIPIGSLLVIVLGVLLVRVERTEATE